MPFFIVRNDIRNMDVDAFVSVNNKNPGKYRAKSRIDVVPPIYSCNDGKDEEALKECYRDCLNKAEEMHVNSVAFPLMASRSFGYPKDIAMKVALSAIEEFLMNSDMTVYLAVFDKKSYELSQKLFGDIDTYIDDNYVEAFPASNVTRRVFGRRRMAEAESKVCGFSSEKPGNMLPQASMSMQTLAMEDAEFCEEPAIPKEKESGRSLEDVTKNLGKTFMEMVFMHADEKGIDDVRLYKGANLDKKAFSKLKSGVTKNPSKNTALSLCLSLELSLDDTRDLLSRAGYALSPCSKTDVIVQYFIEKNTYNINAVNFALFDHGEPCLGQKAED